MGTVSWRRDTCNGTFQYDDLFLIDAVGTENVSFPKPVRLAWPLVDHSDRLSQLLLYPHPPAQFVGSVLVNNSDLIFITVVVRHLFSP